MKEFILNNKLITKGEKTYFIADIAANHDGDVNRAIDLIFLAKESGADCAKFQHFEAKSIVSDFGFNTLNTLETHQSKWKKSVIEVYDQYHTKREWDKKLVNACLDADIDFMTTPYNLDVVNELKEYMPAFKIGSGDITYLPLLEEVSNLNKPVFLATGAASLEEVNKAVKIFDKVPLCLMQCNTNYSGSLENFSYINLNVLKTFTSKYPNIELGLSDHTPGHTTVLGAIALGAVAIEKHFTDDNCRLGPDHSFAMNPKTWSEMIDRARELELSMGDGIKRVEENEKNTIIVQRRAIRAKKDLPIGTKITEKDFEYLRPCNPNEITPMEYKKVIGKRLIKSLKFGEAIKWADLQD